MPPAPKRKTPLSMPKKKPFPNAAAPFAKATPAKKKPARKKGGSK